MEDSVGQRAVGDLETFLASEKISGRQLSPIKLRLEDMIKGMINISINADDMDSVTESCITEAQSYITTRS